MFSAPFTSALATVSHSSYTYNPLHAIRLALATTTRTRLRRITLGHLLNRDTFHFSLVRE
jgi:hypothetical protein